MKTATIHIRNMCCQRCVDAVRDELNKLGLKVKDVKLGEAAYQDSTGIDTQTIETALNKRGFVLIKDEEDILVKNIEAMIFDLVNHLLDKDRKDFSLSSVLEERTGIPYRHSLEVFKKHKGFTIEKYFILQKIEKVKDLIENSNMQFSEISVITGYKSLQHLSTQFKNVTGMTMQKYKTLRVKKRTFIDRI
jgi:AraC family transcriptional regulator